MNFNKTTIVKIVQASRLRLHEHVNKKNTDTFQNVQKDDFDLFGHK